MNAYLRQHPFVIALLFLPSILIVGVLILYPLVNGAVLSFTNDSPIYPDRRWVGFENYEFLLTDPLFWESLYNSVVIIGASIALAVVGGFSIALLLNTGVRGARWFRTGIFQVWIVPWVAVAILWGWIFNSDYGVLNYLLETAGLVDAPVPWLHRPHLAQFVLIVAFAWRLIPFMMVISLAGLQTIPRDLVEAAAVDGATYWMQLRYVVLPLVRNVLVISAMVWAFRLFQEITLPWILTEGGPINATTILSLLTYKIAFEQWDFGLASTVGTVWLTMLMVFAIFYVRVMVRER